MKQNSGLQSQLSCVTLVAFPPHVYSLGEETVQGMQLLQPGPFVWGLCDLLGSVHLLVLMKATLHRFLHVSCATYTDGRGFQFNPSDTFHFSSHAHTFGR